MRAGPLALAAFAIAVLTGQAAAPALAGNGAKRIMLHLANDVVPLDSNASTVAGFLAELSIALPPGLAVEPPLDKALDDGENVFLTSLTVTRGETEREIPPEVQITENWHYGPEQVVLTDAGQPGLVKTECTIFYLGEQEVGRRQREEVLRQMRPQKVVCYRELTSADGPSVEEILATRAAPSKDVPPPKRYKRIVTMESTAYEPGPVSCGNSSGNTAIGLQAGYGVVAVDPDFIGLGARLYIEDYGYAVAGDTGGAIKGNRIDLGFLTLEECYAWGRRDVKVYVLY